MGPSHSKTPRALLEQAKARETMLYAITSAAKLAASPTTCSPEVTAPAVRVCPVAMRRTVRRARNSATQPTNTSLLCCAAATDKRGQSIVVIVARPCCFDGALAFSGGPSKR